MRKLTGKQEKFAQGVAEGLSQADAYRAAYSAGKMKPSTIQVKASELMADGKIAVRVADLRKPAAIKAGITLEGHLNDLMMLRNLAAKSGQYGAAITAEVARGKASGVHVEKTITESTVRNLPPISDDDWL